LDEKPYYLLHREVLAPLIAKLFFQLWSLAQSELLAFIPPIKNGSEASNKILHSEPLI
jgi:hypothetical protein